MRNTFVNTLQEIRSSDDRLKLLVGDLGFSVVERFIEEFPDSFFNIGVAEQNMIGIAAGMASEGLIPFCYSIANFPVFRPAEFIRNLVDYHNLNVSVVTVGGGLAYGNLGYTHHAIQDLSFINSLMNFTIIAPADPSQVSQTLKFSYENITSPKYYRLNRNNEQHIEWLKNTQGALPYFSNLKIKAKQHSAIVTTGSAGMFVERFLSTSPKRNQFPDLHINMPIWGKKFKTEIFEILSAFDEVTIFEDHVKSGGFGNYLRDLDLETHLASFSLVENYVGQVGDQDYFMEKFIEDL